MNIGDTLSITRSVTDLGAVAKRKGIEQTQTGKVVHISSRIIVVDFGNYRESFQAQELITNKMLHTDIEIR